MIDFGYSLIGFLIAIAILVTVHEYGHFWVARTLGVKVLRFSIGFGKSVFSWRRKNDPCMYSIGLIPLGGYVKMLDEREGDVPEDEVDQAFNRQSLSVRSAVVFAGPLFNFIFALFAIWLVFVVGSDDIEPVIGDVVENSVAQQLGFKSGDILTEIDGKPVKTWGQHQFYILHQAMKGLSVNVSVSSEIHGDRDIAIDFAKFDQNKITGQPLTSQIGILPSPPPAYVRQVVENSPAQSAGLQAGDEIVAIDGQAIRHWIEMATAISQRPGEVLKLSILRGEQTFEVSIVPNSVNINGKEYGQIGIYPPSPASATLRYGPIEAIWQSVDYSWRMSVVTLRSLGRMVTRKMSSDNLSGPITIARIAGQTVKSGFADYMKFLAIISISLGLLNLLPIPILDGGHLAYFFYEAISGREPSMRIMIWGQTLGICMLSMLMILAFYNDIIRLLS